MLLYLISQLRTNHGAYATSVGYALSEMIGDIYGLLQNTECTAPGGREPDQTGVPEAGKEIPPRLKSRQPRNRGKVQGYRRGV